MGSRLMVRIRLGFISLWKFHMELAFILRGHVVIFMYSYMQGTFSKYANALGKFFVLMFSFLNKILFIDWEFRYIIFILDY